MPATRGVKAHTFERQPFKKGCSTCTAADQPAAYAMFRTQGPDDVAAAAVLAAAAKDVAAELEGATASSSPPPVRLFSLLQRRVAAVQS